MADQIIVATFTNSNDAYDAATAMKALKDKGIVDFKAKAGVMVKKDDRGNLSLLESKDRPLLGNGRRDHGRCLDRSHRRRAGRRARRRVGRDVRAHRGCGDGRPGFRLRGFGDEGHASRNDCRDRRSR